VPASISRLVRAVGVEPDEGPVVAWAATTFFLVHAGSVALVNASDTFFLKRIGVTMLPLVLLASSLLLVMSTSAVARMAAGREQLPLLARVCFLLAAALLPLWLLALADVRSVFVLLVLISKQVESIAVLVFWVALGGLLHARQAKRLYAPIIGGGTLGEIVGSFASGYLGHTFGIVSLLPLAAATLAHAGVVARRARARVPVPLARTRRGAAAETPSALALLVPLWRDSRLFRILAISALLCGALGPMLYFQFSYVADLATQGSNAELRLLWLYAVFRGGLNVAVLALQLLGTSRLFRRIGVPLASTLSPLIYLLGFFSVSLRLGLEAAVGAMAGANLQDHAVYDPAQKILVTLFPERQRPAATSLIDGPVQRTGGALGNLIVIGVIAVASPAWVSVAGLPIAGAWVAAALLLWRIYPTLLLEVVSARRLGDDSLPLRDLLDPTTQRVLAASLLDPDPQRVRAACALIAAGPSAPAIHALARAAARAPDQSRPLLLQTLHRVLDQNGNPAPAAPAAARALESLLSRREAIGADDRAVVVEAYARLSHVGPDSHAAAVLTRYLADPAAAVRLVATARLHCAGALMPHDGDLDTLLAAGLTSEDLETRHVAMNELRAQLLDSCPTHAAADSATRWTSRLALLTPRLADVRDRARAAEIQADLAARHGGEVASHGAALFAYATDPDPRVRAAVLRFVGAAHLDAHVGWVVERLGSHDEGETAAAAAALRALGPSATNALLDALHRGKRAVRQAALPILRDLHVDAATLRALIEREIEAIQRIHWQLFGLRHGPLADIVLQRLRERIDEGVQTLLLLLATLRNEERFAVLGRLLARSPRDRGRAVLVEALDALLPLDERRRLLPLLDHADPRAARAAARALGRPLPAFDDAVREALADPDRLTGDLLRATLDATPLAATGDLRNTAVHDDDQTVPRMLSPVEIVLHLRSLDLFARLTTRQLAELAAVVHEESFAAGAIIVREGDYGDCMYLVVSGAVQITRAGQYTVGAGVGDLFGEMSLFDGETRIATVTAAHRTRLLRLDRHDLFELMDEQPAIAIGICQTLSRHMRDSLKRVEERRERT